jgi:hypothetical protein
MAAVVFCMVYSDWRTRSVSGKLYLEKYPESPLNGNELGCFSTVFCFFCFPIFSLLGYLYSLSPLLAAVPVVFGGGWVFFNPESRDALRRLYTEPLGVVPRLVFHLPKFSVCDFKEMAALTYLRAMQAVEGASDWGCDLSASASETLRASVQGSQRLQISLNGIHLEKLKCGENFEVEVVLAVFSRVQTQSGVSSWNSSRERWTFSSPKSGAPKWTVTAISRSEKLAGDPSEIPARELAPRTNPSIVSSYLDQDLKRLEAADASFNRQELVSYAKELYVKMQQAWSECDYAEVEDAISPALKGAHATWIDQFQMTLQRNLVSETTIQDVKFSQAAIDGPYLVVTLQILAHMLDVTVDARQETISGSSEQRRYCSEYWTFRRGIGAVEPWVLSLIEQEDQFKLIS